MEALRLTKSPTEIPGFYRITVSHEPVSIQKVIREGLCLPRWLLSSQSVLASSLADKLNALESYPDCISVVNQDAITACGLFQHSDISLDLKTCLTQVTLLSDSVTWPELVKVSKDLLVANWSRLQVTKLHEEMFQVVLEDYVENRKILKRLFGKTVKFRSKRDLYDFPFEKYYTIAHFEDHEELLVKLAWGAASQILRRDSFLAMFTTEEGYVQLFPHLSKFSVSTAISANLLGTHNPVDDTVTLSPGSQQEFLISSFPVSTPTDHFKKHMSLERFEEWLTPVRGCRIDITPYQLSRNFSKTAIGLKHPTTEYHFPVISAQISVYSVALYVTVDSPGTILADTLRAVGRPFSGLKERQVERLAGAIVENLEQRKKDFDEIFKEPWLHLAGPRSMYAHLPAQTKGFEYLRTSPVDEHALALYILLHLRGRKIVWAKHTDQLFLPYDGALALLTKHGDSLGVFVKPSENYK